MTKPLISLAALLALASPSLAQEEPAAPTETPPPSPGEIVAQAPQEEWISIPPEDLLVMTLAPAADGSERKVVIQLMPEPFSQSWVKNIRTFARAQWYDGISVNRVQDNYVVQWGDPNYDNPEAKGKAKPLPQNLINVPEREYVTKDLGETSAMNGVEIEVDPYAGSALFRDGWPIAGRTIVSNMPVATGDGWAANMPSSSWWPVHCYGMVGVGRGMSPDTGTGAELYTVIGHAPRHLVRNIALAGRIVEGIEHLSSLPRGKGQLGFYEDESRRTPILTVRVASDLPEGERPAFEYLATDGESFARYAAARANRRDPFFIVPAGGADICNIPVPVRRITD